MIFYVHCFRDGVQKALSQLSPKKRQYSWLIIEAKTFVEMVRTQVGTTISAKCPESVAYTLLPCVTISPLDKKLRTDGGEREQNSESQRPCTVLLGLEAWGRTMISEIECLSIYLGRQYRKHL